MPYHHIIKYLKKHLYLTLCIIVSIILIGCTADDLVVNDPYAIPIISDPNEKQNRQLFNRQLGLTKSGGEKFANWYTDTIPSYPKERLRDFTQNLKEPLNFVASLLQFKFEKAIRAVMRFSINSILGVFGFVDIMKAVGIKPADEDFGQVLAVWGLRQGDFIILPTGQPSTSRDFLGSLLDLSLNPGIILGATISPIFYPLVLSSPFDIIDTYTQHSRLIAGLYNTSLDPYTTFKISYLNLRRHLILETNSSDLYNLDN